MQAVSKRAPFILYVDDDPDDLELVDETFRAMDVSVDLKGCTSGKEAFEFLESIPVGESLPCVVILDLNMPNWGGLQTLEVIKEHKQYQKIPVYIFTNSDHPQHRATSLSKGAVDFVTKPYKKDELVHICSKFANYCHAPVQKKLN